MGSTLSFPLERRQAQSGIWSAPQTAKGELARTKVYSGTPMGYGLQRMGTRRFSSREFLPGRVCSLNVAS